MPNEKISAMPAASLPLDGTELVPLVQSSTNVQTTVADLLAGAGGNAVLVESGPAEKISDMSRIITLVGNEYIPAVNGAGENKKILDNDLWQLWQESASFLPSITFGGGNTGMVVDINGHFVWTKLLVAVYFNFNFTNLGSSAGVVSIGSLPFPVATFFFATGSVVGTNLAAGTAPTITALTNSTNGIDLYVNDPASNGARRMLDTDLSATTHLTGSVVYMATPPQ